MIENIGNGNGGGNANGGGNVDTIVAGTGISVNNADPENPVVSAAVTSVAGKTGAVTLTPSDTGAAAESHTHSASDITSGTMAPARLGTGTADATKVLYGDGTWKDEPSGGGGGGGIASVGAGSGIAVDSTDPQNPIVSATFVPFDVAPQGHMDADYPTGLVYLYLKPTVGPISGGTVNNVYVPDGGSPSNYRTHYIVQVFDQFGVMVTPDSITVGHMSVTVDMTSFGFDTYYVVVL